MAPTKTFTISTRHTGRRRRITIKVYDDLGDLRQAAEHWHRQIGDDQTGQYDNASAVTHTYESILIGTSGEEERGEAAGIMRLWRERIGSSVISHESVHAASGIYRQDHEPDHGPVHADIDNEEVFAYLVGDITARIVGRLYHYGFYEDE